VGEARKAIVVLGGKVYLRPGAKLAGALGRRVAAAAALYAHHREDDPIVIVTGGRAWNGVVEADAMARALVDLGVPAERIVRERCAMSTRENAHYTALLLRRRGLEGARVVTCRWHMPRAAALFRAQGLFVEPVDAPEGPSPTLRQRVCRWGYEKTATWLDRAWIARGRRGT
jgi:uncharacterized SAM-binding protein YcdF (DUF218 family)